MEERERDSVYSYVYFPFFSSIFEGDIWVKRVTLTQLQSHPQHAQAHSLIRSSADTYTAYSTIILRSYRSRCM
jgi:hypothetical protein